MDFTSFKFHPSVASGIEAAGYTEPTPIQAQALGPVMQGLDVLGLAQTGTGKTAAFVLPLLNRLVKTAPGRVRALVIAPTRELVEQIHADVGRLARFTRVRSATVYGGVGIEPQTKQLRGRADIIVACPGRLLDHIRRGNTDFRSIEALVIDEADQMFDMGFLPDIRDILRHIPARRQTLLFSATMPPPIRRLADEVLRDPVTVQVGQTAPAESVQHTIFPVPQTLKTALLLELLGQTPVQSVLVFTRTKHRTKSLSDKAVQGRLPLGLPAGKPVPEPAPGCAGRLPVREVPDPGGDRHRCARYRRLPDLARGELRHARHPGSLHPPHRPDRPHDAQGGCLHSDDRRRCGHGQRHPPPRREGRPEPYAARV